MGHRQTGTPPPGWPPAGRTATWIALVQSAVLGIKEDLGSILLNPDMD
jgi:hypothetical protein